MLKKSFTEGKDVEFEMFSEWQDNILNLYVLFVGLLTLLVTFCYGIINKMIFGPSFSKILWVIYISFVIEIYL